MSKRIRKQIDELTALDFGVHAGWEFASDEENHEDQDECTVRPLAAENIPHADDQVFIQATFTFPNGATKLGMVTVNADDDVSGHQPVLFEEERPINFYCGGMRPSATEVAKLVKVLSKISSDPLPISYVTDLCDVAGKPLAEGKLNGLYWLADWRTNDIRVAI